MKKITLLFLLTAICVCGITTAFAQDTCDVDQIKTQIAPTVIAEYQMTLQAQGLQIAPRFTPTPAAALGVTSAETASTVPTAAAASSSAASATPGDKASYMGQSVADGTHVQKGQDLDLTWYLQNTGTTTWNSDYMIRFFNGTRMMKSNEKRLGQTVLPGETGNCTVDAVAPSASGEYTMTLVLANDAYENFMVFDITLIVD